MYDSYICICIKVCRELHTNDALLRKKMKTRGVTKELLSEAWVGFIDERATMNIIYSF